MQYIYIIENSINGKFYIGRTNNPHSRRRGHFSELRRGVHCNPRLQAAFNKYGEDSFSFQVVDTAPDDLIEQKEAEWFAYFNHDKSQLYNCHFETFGGPKIFKPHSKESKEKISEAIKNGTRKYIFDILDEGFSTRIGLNALARKHSVGSTTLLRYIPEWESIRGTEYGHHQVVASLERMAVFAEEFKVRGVDVMRDLRSFGLSLETVWKYCADFGIKREDTRLDTWKIAAIENANAAVSYRLKTGCSASEAIKKFGAATTTFYKQWKLRDQFAIA